jgi:tRNA 2-thiouridine synthesizing protein A
MTLILDCSGMRCPIPVLKASKEIRKMAAGDMIQIIATDGQAPKDFKDLCREMGHEYVDMQEMDGAYHITLKKGVL